MAGDPRSILDEAFQRAVDADVPLVQESSTAENIAAIATNLTNRALIRLLLAAALAKSHRPEVDIRKPYTEIGTEDAYSGRHYDEHFIAEFVKQHNLPCNSTTAFLTPALRNIGSTLSLDLAIVGRPKTLYKKALAVLDAVHQGRLSPQQLLAESLRVLLIYKREKDASLATLMQQLHASRDTPPLSSEGIVTLIEQHLKSPNASRLPVLIVAAAYSSAAEFLQESPRPLLSHNAADLQTGALGDVEITLVSDDAIVTSYEMKTKRVTRLDIDYALEKIKCSHHLIDNYIFITTDTITDEVQEYAGSIYPQSGIEVVILDCLSFLRHFLHLLHRTRMRFLDEYQRLLLAEPESAVRQELKQVFVALRLAAQSSE